MIRHISSPTNLLVGVLLALALTQTSSANGLLKKRSVVLHASRRQLTLPCRPGDCSVSRSCPKKFEGEIKLTSEAKEFHKQAMYTYTVTGGVVVGEGSEVTWDLSGFGPGYYTATVEVRDKNKNHADSSVTVTVANCSDCITDCEDGWPTIVVICYDTVKAGTPITCRVDVGPSTLSRPIAYKWSARSSRGEDLSERITSNGRYASIPTNGLAGQTVYTRVDLPGLDRSCTSAASSSTKVGP
jgi:hypothetical protein